ncbi:dsDNA-specific endonuclease/ATPase MutS2 [Paenibacillus sp. 4624]|uniref:hypothetical protein n=1 Tax=Paenibacillus sp. 4624 TaxID=3156453 RepID=UPI003D213893
MNKTELELRLLMNKYCDELAEIKKDIKEAQNDKDAEAEVIGRTLERNMRRVISSLFNTMKTLGELDEEEIEFGATKKLLLINLPG